MQSKTRLAVDIGGTFTDVVLEVGENRFTTKVLSTPDRPDEGVMAGIADVLMQSGAEPNSLDLLIHGTTLATNAILERKGAPTALITSDGFRDVLDIGYESRHDQYDIHIDKPTSLVPRERRLTVPERVNIHGDVIEPLDEAAVVDLVPALKSLNIESLAIGYLHAYANPTHEQRTRDILKHALPNLSMSLSSEVCPEIREYERLTTTAANAYVRPLMAAYLDRLRTRLREEGFDCPVLLMTSGGGLTSLENAIQFPVRLIESGPAGGAILACRIAAEMSMDKMISFDMGGTTAKICLISNHTAQKAREFEVDRQARFMKGSGLPLRIPVIEMVEIGAGGGSIARLDAMKRITIGPDSAGSDPGPAAYGRGGTRPTVTDGDIVLGKIDPARFAGGKVALNPDQATDAIKREVGDALDLDGHMAAFGIVEMVDETMANAARVHAVEQGKNAGEHGLVAFGGAAPLHVSRLAEKLGIDRIVVPTDAGVGSAIGFLRAPIAYEVVRSRNMRLGRFDAPAANAVLAEMLREAEAVVRSGALGAELTEHRMAFMRYWGQGHEIVVPLPARALTAEDGPTLIEAFEAEYARLYKRIIPNAEIEVLTWALTLSTRADAPEAVGEPESRQTPEPAGERPVFDHEKGVESNVPLYSRSALEPGTHVPGPALIVEDATSTFVSKRFTAHIACNGYIVMERSREAAE